MEEAELRIARAAVLKELLSRVGYAVWQAAECEDTLAHYVVLRLRTSRGVGEEKGSELLSKAQNRTFGHLLKELREQGVLNGGLEQRLTVLLEERNWIVHRAKRESRGVLNNPERLDALVDRLERAGNEATELNTLLEKELEDFIVSSGVSRESIDRKAAELLAELGY